MSSGLELFGQAGTAAAPTLPGAGGRLRYSEAPAPPDLGGTVACAWRSEVVSDAPARPLVIPDGCTEIVVSDVHPPLVFGPTTAAHQLELPAGTAFAGLRLRPGRAAAVLSVSVAELTDRVVPLAALLDDTVLPWVTTTDAIRYLRRRLRVPAAGPDPSVAAAVTLLSCHPSTTIAEVARIVGSSPRTLGRRFRAEVGLRPIEYRRIARFRHALAAARRNVPLSRIAAETGYADQAHMTREFRRLTARTPQALRTD